MTISSQYVQPDLSLADAMPNTACSVPLEKTFWAERFGMLVDRSGIPWLINCEGSEQSAVG